MKQTNKQQLDEIVKGFSSEDLHAVITYAKFLQSQKKEFTTQQMDEMMTEKEHLEMIAALQEVVEASSKTGPPVSNLDHDKYLYSQP